MRAEICGSRLRRRPRRSGVRWAGWLAAAAVLAGCAGPGPQRHATPPASPEAGSGASASRGDRLFAGLVALERETYIRALIERNPTLLAARHAWSAALERPAQVAAFDDPMVGYGVAPLSFGEPGIDDAHVVDLAQKLPFPGKLRLRGEAAAAEAEAARGDFEAVRLRLATMGSMLYDDYYYAARARELNRQHLDLMEGFQRIALVRYEAGRATQQDPLQAETELARLVQRELELETLLQVTRHRLNALLHRPADADLPPPPDVLVPLPLPFDEATAVALSAAASEQRPEVDAAEARVRAEEARVGSARREFFPDVTLVGNYNRRLPIDENRPFVGIRFDVPLQVGRRRAALREAQSRLLSARSRRESVADEVELSVHVSLAEWERAREVEALFADRLLPAARDRIAAAQAGFEAGRNSFLELVDAERELRRVELDREAARADVSRRSAQLLRAVGRVPGVEETP